MYIWNKLIISIPEIPDDFEENLRSLIPKLLETVKPKIECNTSRMFNLMLQYPKDADKQEDLLETFFKPAVGHFVLKTLTDLFEMDSDSRTIGNAFLTLLDNNQYKEKSVIEIAKVLLDYKFPVNEFMYSDEGHRYISPEALTPLQLSIKKNKFDIVSKQFIFFNFQFQCCLPLAQIIQLKIQTSY